MLPATVPEARIYTYDWATDYSNGDPVQKFHENANRLLRLVTESQGSQERPIIFVSSCFGGLILVEVYNPADHRITYAKSKQALKRAAQGSNDYQRVLRSTVGIVFLGTPFSSDHAIKQIPWNLIVAGIMAKRAPSQIIKSLKNSDKELRELTKSFTEIAMSELHQVPICCFYETDATEILKRTISGSLGCRISSIFHKKTYEVVR